MLRPPSEAPTPILPRGAGGPQERAAGRVHPAFPMGEESADGMGDGVVETPAMLGAVAVVIEPDQLLRLHVESAARRLGFAVVSGGDGDSVRARVGVVFFGLGSSAACLRRAAPFGRAPLAAPRDGSLVVGYAAGRSEVLAAHRLHGCCDVFLELRADAGRARFAYPPVGSIVQRARLTAREADVLVLLLGGASTAGVADRLCVAPATARTHCRALLRKFGAADRRALRALLLGAPDGASVTPPPRVSASGR